MSDEIRRPVTFGLRRPVIFLPPGFHEMDQDRQRAIATHELLHVTRRDWVLNLMEEIILAVFWFHPVVWRLVNQIRLSREQLVDQQVVQLTGFRQPYVYALLEIAAGPRAVRGLVAPAFLHECQLAERIRSLVKEDCMSKRRMIVALVCVATLALVTGFVVVRSFPLKAVGLPPTMANPTNTTDKVFKVGHGVSAPVPIYKPEPSYTAQAKAAKIQGNVALSIVIAADGAVKDVAVAKSLDPGLDQNAMNTIRTWKFKPAMKAGKAVACKVKVEVAFKIW